jgi:quinoprotein glucose dehydrogenase
MVGKNSKMGAMTIKFPFLVLMSTAALGVATAGALRAQAPGAAKTTNDGVFTDAQVKRGNDVYQAQCSACHDAQLTGSGTAPALSGTDFSANWKDETVGSLFERIRATMPADNPGSLQRPQVADLIAFILNFNKYPTGPSELAADLEALKAIKISAVK